MIRNGVLGVRPCDGLEAEDAVALLQAGHLFLEVSSIVKQLLL